MIASADDLPTPAECAATLEFLHRRLDGATVDLPGDVAAHVAGCGDCRGRLAASGRLAAAPVSHDPPVPALLAERIVARLLADARRRRQLRRWPVALVGLAAAIAFAVWLGRPPAPTLPAPAPELARQTPAPAPNLRQDVTEAGEAVAALTRRTATDAVGAGRQLIPAVPPPPWPTLEADARPFEGAGAALADGFEPVATSARRAARLFWRELALVEED